MARNLLSENQIKKLFKDHDPEKVERHNDGDGLIFEMRKKGQPRWVFRYTKLNELKKMSTLLVDAYKGGKP